MRCGGLGDRTGRGTRPAPGHRNGAHEDAHALSGGQAIASSVLEGSAQGWWQNTVTTERESVGAGGGGGAVTGGWQRLAAQTTAAWVQGTGWQKMTVTARQALNAPHGRSRFAHELQARRQGGNKMAPRGGHSGPFPETPNPSLAAAVLGPLCSRPGHVTPPPKKHSAFMAGLPKKLPPTPNNPPD